MVRSPSTVLPCLLSLLLLSLSSLSLLSASPSESTVCIIGSGISGASLAHFLRKYSPAPVGEIRVFERNAVVGGRMATVTIGGDTFESGASIIHPKNYHLSNFTSLLKLKRRLGDGDGDDCDSLGVWDGKRFVVKTLRSDSKFPIVNKAVSLINTVKLFWRYGFSLLRMQSFVETMLNNFLKLYESSDTRPVFGRVEDMLKWSGLYNLTRRTLEEELIDAGLSPLLIQELVTVITRINYGQSVRMSGLAGAVSLAGSGGGLWAVEGGNWQMADRKSVV